MLIFIIIDIISFLDIMLIVLAILATEASIEAFSVNIRDDFRRRAMP